MTRPQGNQGSIRGAGPSTPARAKQGIHPAALNKQAAWKRVRTGVEGNKGLAKPSCWAIEELEGRSSLDRAWQLARCGEPVPWHPWDGARRHR